MSVYVFGRVGQEDIVRAMNRTKPSPPEQEAPLPFLHVPTYWLLRQTSHAGAGAGAGASAGAAPHTKPIYPYAIDLEPPSVFTPC